MLSTSVADDLLIEPYWLGRLLRLRRNWLYMYLTYEHWFMTKANVTKGKQKSKTIVQVLERGWDTTKWKTPVFLIPSCAATSSQASVYIDDSLIEPRRLQDYCERRKSDHIWTSTYSLWLVAKACLSRERTVVSKRAKQSSQFWNLANFSTHLASAQCV